MHPELPRLLDLQTRDLHLAALATRRRALLTEQAGLDTAVERLEGDVQAARRMATEHAERRDALAKKLETQRATQEKRRERLEQERNPRVAAQLMADLEMARGILAQEEGEWVRMADDVGGRDRVVQEAEERLAAAREEQAPARAALAESVAGVDAEIAAAKAERETAAGQVEKTLRLRYDRLRGSRKTAVIVPVVRNACTGCYTSIPSSRIGPLEADGVLFEGCQMCGAIIYLAEAT